MIEANFINTFSLIMQTLLHKSCKNDIVVKIVSRHLKLNLTVDNTPTKIYNIHFSYLWLLTTIEFLYKNLINRLYVVVKHEKERT